MNARTPRALLLSMPWAALGEPSLGLGVLKACLEQSGIAVRVRHFNLFLLRHLRASTYVGLANAYALNDFVFTHDLDPRVSGVQYRLARERLTELSEIGVLSLAEDPDAAVERLISARRDLFAPWLDECAEFVVAERPTLVGFTCLFDQTIASIALAHKIRQRLPEATIVLGGYAMEGPVAAEVLRCFDWIDAVCLGEGEPAIVDLALASAGLRPLAGIANTLTRQDHAVAPSETPIEASGSHHRIAVRPPLATRALPMAMDDSPVPSFDDYFSDLDELDRVDQVRIEFDTLPIESSRGCWWGQKNHCVFCGIDDETMRYRARTPENTLEMLRTLSTRHGIRSFRFSDYILPYTYFRTLLPALAQLPEKYHLECEVKANLTPEHFEQLRAAGFGECQPGIESFSSSVLRKMRKGVTAIHNVQTLVLGKRNGIRIHYNFLFGFPFDEPEEYEAMLALVPLLYHLDPPHGRQSVEITRFAPLQADPQRFGIESGSATELYRTIFSPEYLSETGFDLDSYAYYFERTFENSQALQKTYAMLCQQIDYWKTIQATRKVELSWEAGDAGIVFRDSRYAEQVQTLEFGGRHRDVFLACASAASAVDDIADRSRIAVDTTVRILEELADARLVMSEGSRFLGLAMPRARAAETPKFKRKWVVA